LERLAAGNPPHLSVPCPARIVAGLAFIADGSGRRDFGFIAEFTPHAHKEEIGSLPSLSSSHSRHAILSFYPCSLAYY
jgi:hypothetical protein